MTLSHANASDLFLSRGTSTFAQDEKTAPGRDKARVSAY